LKDIFKKQEYFRCDGEELDMKRVAPRETKLIY